MSDEAWFEFFGILCGLNAHLTIADELDRGELQKMVRDLEDWRVQYLGR